MGQAFQDLVRLAVRADKDVEGTVKAGLLHVMSIILRGRSLPSLYVLIQQPLVLSPRQAQNFQRCCFGTLPGRCSWHLIAVAKAFPQPLASPGAFRVPCEA